MNQVLAYCVGFIIPLHNYSVNQASNIPLHVCVLDFINHTKGNPFALVQVYALIKEQDKLREQKKGDAAVLLKEKE